MASISNLRNLCSDMVTCMGGSQTDTHTHRLDELLHHLNTTMNGLMVNLNVCVCLCVCEKVKRKGQRERWDVPSLFSFVDELVYKSHIFRLLWPRTKKHPWTCPCLSSHPLSRTTGTSKPPSPLHLGTSFLKILCSHSPDIPQCSPGAAVWHWTHFPGSCSCSKAIAKRHSSVDLINYTVAQAEALKSKVYIVVMCRREHNFPETDESSNTQSAHCGTHTFTKVRVQKYVAIHYDKQMFVDVVK